MEEIKLINNIDFKIHLCREKSKDQEELILMNSILELSFYFKFNIFCEARRFYRTQGAGKDTPEEERCTFSLEISHS